MTKTLIFILAFCSMFASCEKDKKFMEGQYYTMYKGQELIFHVYEYDKGKFGWLLNATSEPSNLLGGTLTIDFKENDTLATFKGILIGDDYKGSFVGLNEQTEKIHYRRFEDIDIMKFSPINYVFTKSRVQPQENEKKIMINVMREKFLFEDDNSR